MGVKCRQSLFNWRSAIGALVILAMLGSGLAYGASHWATSPVVTVGKGMAGGHNWFVVVDVEGPSICLETAVMVGGSRRAEKGVGRCSYPVPRRGILQVVPNDPVRPGEPPLVTAVGGAFSPAVRKVVAEMFSGKRVVLPLHRLSTDEPVGIARRFKYLHFGVKGTWCARRVTTYNRRGMPLMNVNWKLLGSRWRAEPDNSPRKLCEAAR
jgi:hypothetical protein